MMDDRGQKLVEITTKIRRGNEWQSGKRETRPQTSFLFRKRKRKTITFSYTSIFLLYILVSIFSFSFSFSSLLLNHFVLFFPFSPFFLWKLNRFNGHVDKSYNTRHTLCIIEQSNKNSNKSTSFVSAFVSSPPICNEKASDCGYNYRRCTDGHWPSICGQHVMFAPPDYRPRNQIYCGFFTILANTLHIRSKRLLRSLIPVLPFFLHGNGFRFHS